MEHDGQRIPGRQAAPAGLIKAEGVEGDALDHEDDDLDEMISFDEGEEEMDIAETEEETAEDVSEEADVEEVEESAEDTVE